MLIIPSSTSKYLIDNQDKYSKLIVHSEQVKKAFIDAYSINEDKIAIWPVGTPKNISLKEHTNYDYVIYFKNRKVLAKLGQNIVAGESLLASE